MSGKKKKKNVKKVVKQPEIKPADEATVVVEPEADNNGSVEEIKPETEENKKRYILIYSGNAIPQKKIKKGKNKISVALYNELINLYGFISKIESIEE